MQWVYVCTRVRVCATVDRRGADRLDVSQCGAVLSGDAWGMASCDTLIPHDDGAWARVISRNSNLYFCFMFSHAIGGTAK